MTFDKIMRNVNKSTVKSIQKKNNINLEKKSA